MNQKTLNQRDVLVTGFLACSYLHVFNFSNVSKNNAEQMMPQSQCGLDTAFSSRSFKPLTRTKHNLIAHCLEKAKKVGDCNG